MSRSKPPTLKPGPSSLHQPGEHPTAGTGVTWPRNERRVTDRRHLSDPRDRKFRLRAVARVTGTGVYDFDFATGTNYWSPELKSIAGLPDDASDVSLEQMVRLAHPEDSERFVRQVEASLLPQGNGHFEGEYRIVRPDGALRWVRVWGQAFFTGDAQERRILGASGIVIDITEQRNFLEELRKFKFFSDHSSESNLVVDSEGHIRYANRQLCERLGYSEEEMLRLYLEDISLNFNFQTMFSELVERSKGGSIPPFESIRRRKDGSTYPVEASATALKIQGEWLVFLVSRDITERKIAEARIQALNAELEARVKERTAQLQESNEALLQSNTELRHFAHATAHDLQTPLRSIAGFTQLLQREVQGWGNEQIDTWAAAVVENTRRLQLLIRDILSYTRLETQGRPFEITDLGRLFDEVVASLSILIGETGAEVTCSALPALPVDRTQIAQVLQNLIENGIKYNHSTPPRVAVAGELQEDQWVFSVADNGIGIDPKHFDRIFTLFQRLHPYHRFPGAGIGLPLCRRIVERHGGHVWVESRPGEGSTFYFSLPVKRVEEA